MDERDGIERLRATAPAHVVKDILGWRDHPELGVLYNAIAAIRDEEKHLDALAEALIARRLVACGCELRVEVPTPAGKSCDFEVTTGGVLFYLHLKRINTDRPEKKRLAVSSRLRYLEQIQRPYVVRVRWQEHLDDRQMQRLVTSAAEFIRHARVGDELIVHDDDGIELGGCRIVAPWEGKYVSLTIGLPTGFIDIAPRFAKLMQRAHKQFMPKAVNVIMTGSSHVEDVGDFETALLGSHIERWDRHPPAGRRIAHGRAADGFWSGSRFHESEVAGWFKLDPADDWQTARLWIRDGAQLADADRAAIEAVLGPAD